MALQQLLLFLTLQFIAGRCQNSSGNSYYLKMDKKSQVRVWRRVELNHNISDYDYTHGNWRKSASSEVVKTPLKPVVTLDPEKFFLDPEWDYNHRELDKTKIPKFLDEFYKDFDGNTVRVLFNDHKNSSSSIIKFNLESITEKDNISYANMFLYWPLEENSTIYKTSVVLRLYQIQRHGSEIYNETYLLENPDVHKLSNAIYISKAQRGWQAFTIRKPVQNWLLKKEGNLGLVLTVSNYGENKPLYIFNDTNQGVFRTFAAFTFKQNKTYTKNHTEISNPSKQCTKRSWFVNFKKLFWDRFIIKPDGYSMNDCVGNCHRIDEHQKNHVKFINVFGKSTSCCVPDTYLPLPIMYFDKYENVAIKLYNNMIAHSCSCR